MPVDMKWEFKEGYNCHLTGDEDMSLTDVQKLSPQFTLIGIRQQASG